MLLYVCVCVQKFFLLWQICCWHKAQHISLHDVTLGTNSPPPSQNNKNVGIRFREHDAFWNNLHKVHLKLKAISGNSKWSTVQITIWSGPYDLHGHTILIVWSCVCEHWSHRLWYINYINMSLEEKQTDGFFFLSDRRQSVVVEKRGGGNLSLSTWNSVSLKDKFWD